MLFADVLALPPLTTLLTCLRRQMVNVSRDEEAPEDIWEAQEDMRLFSADMVDRHGKPREYYPASTPQQLPCSFPSASGSSCSSGSFM